MSARRRASRAVGPLLVGLLPSCISIGTTKGYEPSEPVALYEGALPPGSPATPVVSLAAGALLIVQAWRADVYPTPGIQITLDVRLLVPEGVGVQVLAPELVLTSPAWAEARTLPIACIVDCTDSPSSAHAATALLVGTDSTHAYPGFVLSFVTEGPSQQTRIPEVAEFELRLPAFRVDGEVVTPGPIRFRAFERFGVSFPPD